MLGTYIHIPFCKKKCFYCDFFSVGYSEYLSSQYIEALSAHCRKYKNKKTDTVYIGGGTPSVLSEKQIEKLLYSIRDNFDLSDLKEFTFELNPESASKEKLKILKDMGINRLSMGLQSVDDEFLKKIGRVHDFKMFKDAYANARNAGFENFNIDLIYGLPGQTIKNWEKNLQEAMTFECEHISLYPLSIEEGTMFHKNSLSTDDEMQRNMFEIAADYLNKNDFIHYEISNWAKSGKESLHNSNYWRNFEYIALGAGASGYENRFRYSNFESIEKYISLVFSGLCVKHDNDYIDDGNFESEAIMLGLRLLEEGVDIKTFKRTSNIDALQKLMQENMLINENGRIKLQKSIIFTSNTVMSYFMK